MFLIHRDEGRVNFEHPVTSYECHSYVPYPLSRIPCPYFSMHRSKSWFSRSKPKSISSWVMVNDGAMVITFL